MNEAECLKSRLWSLLVAVYIYLGAGLAKTARIALCKNKMYKRCSTACFNILHTLLLCVIQVTVYIYIYTHLHRHIITRCHDVYHSFMYGEMISLGKIPCYVLSCSVAYGKERQCNVVEPTRISDTVNQYTVLQQKGMHEKEREIKYGSPKWGTLI